MKLFISLFGWCVFTLACHDTGQALQTTLLINCWHHSFEEDTHMRVLTFRPCDHPLPSTEVRNRIILKEHNAAEYLYYADDDGNFMTPGTWEYEPENRYLTIYDSEGMPVWKYRVEDVQSDVLRVWLLDDYF